MLVAISMASNVSVSLSIGLEVVVCFGDARGLVVVVGCCIVVRVDGGVVVELGTLVPCNCMG